MFLESQAAAAANQEHYNNKTQPTNYYASWLYAHGIYRKRARAKWKMKRKHKKRWTNINGFYCTIFWNRLIALSLSIFVVVVVVDLFVVNRQRFCPCLNRTSIVKHHIRRIILFWFYCFYCSFYIFRFVLRPPFSRGNLPLPRSSLFAECWSFCCCCWFPRDSRFDFYWIHIKPHIKMYGFSIKCFSMETDSKQPQQQMSIPSILYEIQVCLFERNWSFCDCTSPSLSCSHWTKYPYTQKLVCVAFAEFVLNLVNCITTPLVVVVIVVFAFFIFLLHSQ